MRIHHLDCGPMRPPGGALMDGVSHGRAFGHLTCHCLAIETPRHGVVLVDTGLGIRDMLRPWPRLPWLNAMLLRIRFDPDRTMLRRLKQVGLHPADVRHIVMTHLDFDHAGGLVDFPRARVHVMAEEAAAARRPEGLLDRVRYRRVQWGDTARWRAYAAPAGERWFGFDAVRPLVGLPPEILLVPLPGHSAGHAGVAVAMPDGGWRLHAGDAYFNRAEVHGEGGTAPIGAAAYEGLMADRPSLMRHNRARLRALVRGTPGAERIAVFCTHDPVEYVAMAILEGRRALPVPANDLREADAA